MIYALLFISTIFMTSSLNTMEIIKNNKNKKVHTEKNCWGNDIVTQLILTQRVCDKNKLPQEIITQIHAYNFLLKHKHFANNFTCINQWNDFLIPTKYHYLLSPQQINILETLFKTKPCIFDSWDGYGVSGYMYFLPSKKDYKKFLTLPIELRKCLVKLPQSKIKNKLTDHYINTNKAIGIITWRTRGLSMYATQQSIEQKLIVPEDKEDKIYHKRL